MIEKICPIHNVPVYGEKCIYENCEERPLVSTTIYWCDECKIPVFEQECKLCGKPCKYLSTDLRPVFPEEKLLLAILLEMDDLNRLDDVSIWNSSSGYFFDGVRKNIRLGEINKKSLEEIQQVKKIYDENLININSTCFESMIEKFIEANSDRYYDITDEASKFIQSYETKYAIEDMFVSFSGGKDSTVTSDLVTKALANRRIQHIFGDTTLEFPLTYEYKSRFAKSHSLIRAKNYEKKFEELCKQIGPPSRVMRWCCTVFKTGPITKKLSQIFKDKTNVLTFYGIRKSESTSRSKYERESESPKIAMQTTVSPIIDWIDFDVWLYILTTRIDFNDAYRLGYSRVGCWCCPNNGIWSEFLSKVHMYDEYVKWRNILIDFAKGVGKSDAEEYIDGGNWKARQGGNGMTISNTSIIKYEPCATEDNSFNYELQGLITDELYELFKPFGYINKEIGNKRLGEVYVFDKAGNITLVLQGRLGTNRLKVAIKKKNIAGATSMLQAEGKIKCQLTKYQMCIDCKGCLSTCKHNAINIQTVKIEDEEDKVIYYIDDEKCVRCGKCIDHFNGGCYMRKVLTIKRS